MVNRKKLIGIAVILILLLQMLTPIVLGAEEIVVDTDNSEEIIFGDDNLKELLLNNENINKNNDDIITKNELSNLTELYLNTDYDSLKGLEFATNLTRVTLTMQKVETIEKLRTIPNLTSLNLTFNNVNNEILELKNIGDLTNLKSLYISVGNSKNVLDLKEIENCISLTSLHINVMQLINIESIQNLEKLEDISIDVYSNGEKYTIPDGIFNGLDKIKNLQLSEFNNTNLSFLKNLEIENLYLSSDMLKDLSFLKSCSITNLTVGNINEQNNFTEIANSDELKDTDIKYNRTYNVNLENVKQNANYTYNIVDIAPAFNELFNTESRFYSESYDVYTYSYNNQQEVQINKENNTFSVETSNIQNYNATIEIYTDNLQINIYLSWKPLEEGDTTKEIEFEDTNLKRYMIDKYDIDNDKKITEYDMNQIVDLYIEYNVGVSSLKGLENLKNVKQLSIYNCCKDISPITNLTTLENLSLYGNEIDITGIGNLKNLKSFYLSENDENNQSTKNYSEISNLTNLGSLLIYNCKNFDVNVIKNMKNLTSLQLSYGTILNYEQIGNISTLTQLTLSSFGSNVSDIAFISKLKNLNSCYFSDNMIKDITPFEQLMNLYNVDLSKNPINLDEENNSRTLEILKQRKVNINIDKYKEAENINFKDLELKKELIAKGYDINRDNEISTYEMQLVTSFESYTGNITSIDDLAYAKNIENLRIMNVYNGQIDLKVISELTKLNAIYVSGNNIVVDDFSELEKLTKLKTLSIGDYDTEEKTLDFEGLEKYTNLDSLNISGNYKNMSEIFRLNNLKSLTISQTYSSNNTEIIDLSLIKNFSRLETLSINAKFCNYEVIFENENIKNLTLNSTYQESINLSGIEKMPKLEVLYVSGKLKNVDKIYQNNNITDLTINMGYSYDNNSILELNGIDNMTNLRKLAIIGFIQDITPLENFDKLERLSISNTQYYMNDTENIKTITDEELLASLKKINVDELSIGGYYTHRLQKYEKNSNVVLSADDIGGLLKATTNQDEMFYNTQTQIRNYNTYNPSLEVDNENKLIKLDTSKIGENSDGFYLSSRNINCTIGLIWNVYQNADNTKEISIEDNNLRQYILENHDLDDDKKITQYDMINIGKINIANKNISSLNGLENATNLREINAAHNNISDLNPIKDLTNLESIDFVHNKIKDISPLEKLVNLGMSANSLCNNLIEDITPLKEFDPEVARQIDFMGNYIDVSEGTKNREALEKLGFDQYTMACFEISQKYKSPDERNDILEIKDTLKQKLISYGIDSNNDGNITKGEMNDFNCGETSREGSMFEKCELDLSNLGLTDKDIECLKYLNCITGLNLSNNNITDISSLKYIRTITNLNLSHNEISNIDALKEIDTLYDIDLSYNYIENISVFNNYVPEPVGYGWFAGGGDGGRYVQINLSNNKIKDINSICTIVNLASVNLSNNKIADISCLKDYDFCTYEYDGEIYEDIEGFQLVDVSYNYIDINKQGNEEAIETFTSRGIPFKYDNQTVIQEGTYIGNINSELKQFNVGIGAGNASYVSGEIVVVEWIDGVSTVPKVTPKMRFKSTDGTIDMDVFVTATGTNTYYFDRYIEGIDTTKEYYFEIESGDSKNVSENKKMNVYFSNTKFENTVVGKYHGQRIRLSGQKIIFEEDTYVGNLNTELKQFNVGIGANNASYVSGEIVVVEWVDGKSTVPKVAPKMRFKSTDGTIDMEVFVTATGTNTYYFDRYVEGINTSKEYYFEVESGDSRNVSEYNKVNVYYSGTKFNNTVAGKYHGKRIRLSGQKITFEEDTYVGNLNTELKQFNVGIGAGNASYVSGEIVVVEWVDGKSTVPQVSPKMRFKSTDGTIDMEVFVTATGTNTYYFDRYIEGIDTSKQYYFEVESGDSRNVSEYNKVNVYFTGTKFNNTVAGKYHNYDIRLLGQKIIFEGGDNKTK